MLLLSRHSEYMLRLGWLRVLARLAARPDVRRADLGSHLFKYVHPNLETWLGEAGLIVEPRGTFSQRAASRLPGMAQQFSIYDAGREQLTDLGWTLHHAELRQPGAAEGSPFVWPTSLRFIGLRILVGADGDLLLRVLRDWPEDGVLLEPLPFIAGVARALRPEAAGLEEQRELDRILSITSDQQAAMARAYWTTIYPILEPLRELGYLQRERIGEKSLARYVLSPSGARLRSALRDGPMAGAGASSILESHLSRLFFLGESLASDEAPAGEELRITLLDLPEMLLAGSFQEAPLEPVVLLTQARLITAAPGMRIELAAARESLGQLGRITEGRVGLKTGRTARESNVFWNPAASLTDPSLWCVDENATSPAAVGGDTTPAPGDEEPRDAEPPEDATEPVPPAPHLEAAPLSPATPLRVFLWLQYLGRRLEEPSLGGIQVFRPGGPWAWMKRLHHLAGMEPRYLDGKRQPQPLPWNKGGCSVPAIHLLQEWLEGVPPPPGAAEADALRLLRKVWEDPSCRVPLLRASLEAAFEAAASSVSLLLEREIKAFLTGTPKGRPEEELKEWTRVALMTDALVEDAIERQLMVREELLELFHQRLSGGPSPALALEMLRALAELPGPSRWIVRQPALAPGSLLRFVDDFVRAEKRSLSYPEGEELKDGFRVELESDEKAGTDERRLLITVTLDARSRALAAVRARDVTWETLKRLRWLVTLQSGALEAGDGDLWIADDAPPTITDGIGNPSSVPEPFDRNVVFAPPRRFVRAPSGHVRSWQDVWTLPVDALQTGGDMLLPEAALDAPARLARTLHWLAAADQKGLRAAHRLSNVWVAMEHLVVEPGEEHGASVACTLADVGALCRLRALADTTALELCEALCRTRSLRGGDPSVKEELSKWEQVVMAYLGDDAHDLIVGRRTDAAAVPEGAGFDLLLAVPLTDLTEIARTIEMESPWASSLLLSFKNDILKNASVLGDWLRGTRRDIQALVLHAYEVRNLLFHDGATFGFDESARLDNLYVRFRLVTDRVVSRFAQGMFSPRRRATASIWADLRHPVRALLFAADAGKDMSVDRGALRLAVSGPPPQG